MAKNRVSEWALNSSALCVGIRFCDNDYGATIRHFLKLLNLRALWVDDTYQELTKAKVVQMFNETSAGLAMMFQRRNWDRDDIELYRRYLKITEDNVFFGEEINKHIKEYNGDDNGEFHYLAGGVVVSV